ncbi:MAG: PEP-CTERM sorting domain-containing protein [Phycisphaerae bacterium]|nr:PEP-CTERM sorting domain-containing protein [Phycisphaerae bacterium]
MKKFVTLLLVLGMCSVVSAGTMTISGLPAKVDTSGGDVVLSFDIVSNGQLDNALLDIWTDLLTTSTGATLDIGSAVNVIVPGEIDDDPANKGYLPDFGIDITNVAQPVLWANIIIPKSIPEEIVGDIITGIGLTVASGFEGFIDVKVLSENSELVEGSARFEAIPEPMTIALLGLGGLFLRRRK